jgi:NAD(P)-dependent dehydrogenase (short-subunit alcohol dehydrogenase family)
VAELGHDVLAIQADITDIEATERAVAKLVAKFGKIDIVFALPGSLALHLSVRHHARPSRRSFEPI